jgi:ribonuclease VapC
MIFVDTSAIVAILIQEPDFKTIINAISNSKSCWTAPHVRLEACMVLSSRLNLSPLEAEKGFDKFLNQSEIMVLDITDHIAHLAVIAFAKYGKGRGHPAQLNLADCLSYACAKAHNAPILFKGRDFSHTDLEIVKY